MGPRECRGSVLGGHFRGLFLYPHGSSEWLVHTLRVAQLQHEQPAVYQQQEQPPGGRRESGTEMRRSPGPCDSVTAAHSHPGPKCPSSTAARIPGRRPPPDCPPARFIRPPVQTLPSSSKRDLRSTAPRRPTPMAGRQAHKTTLNPTHIAAPRPEDFPCPATKPQPDSPLNTAAPPYLPLPNQPAISP